MTQWYGARRALQHPTEPPYENKAPAVQDDDHPPGGYASASASVALASGFFAFLVVAACLWSFYRDALEQQFICDAANCVIDSRTWFERHPGAWSLGLGLAAICVVSTAVSRRQPTLR